MTFGTHWNNKGIRYVDGMTNTYYKIMMGLVWILIAKQYGTQLNAKGYSKMTGHHHIKMTEHQHIKTRVGSQTDKNKFRASNMQDEITMKKDICLANCKINHLSHPPVQPIDEEALRKVLQFEFLGDHGGNYLLRGSARSMRLHIYPTDLGVSIV